MHLASKDTAQESIKSPKILIIQTAFLGDVILATALVEDLKRALPSSTIDFLVRKGNQGILKHCKSLNKILVWDKKYKYKDAWRILQEIRSTSYDWVINLQRFATTGVLTVFSAAKLSMGFDKNPLSFFYSKRFPHLLGTIEHPLHEVQRNRCFLSSIPFDSKIPARPYLDVSEEDINKISAYTDSRYVCLAPASVWNSKQMPKRLWIDLAKKLASECNVWIIGGPEDIGLCEDISHSVNHENVRSLCGKLSLTESLALIGGAALNYVNDSAPMHMASARNAPVCAIYCSTSPSFGFGPLSDRSWVIETPEKLECKPCGLHGKKECPLQHFLCGESIRMEDLWAVWQEAKQ